MKNNLNYEKMKKLLIYGLVSVSCLGLYSQQVPENDQKVIDNYIRSASFNEVHPILSDTLQRVFSGKFYNVAPGFKSADGSVTCNNYHFNINGANIAELEELSNDKDLMQMPGLLQKGFFLNDEKSAGLFEVAINKIYPPEREDKGLIRHLKKNNQWIFIRGKFFENYKAIVVTVDPKGTVTKISFTLDYKM